MSYVSGVAKLPTGGFTGPLLVCEGCGAAVVDRVVHDAFHDRLGIQVTATAALLEDSLAPKPPGRAKRGGA